MSPEQFIFQAFHAIKRAIEKNKEKKDRERAIKNMTNNRYS